MSCQKVAINLTALGEETLIFPEGKLMTKHQTLETGFEYEVINVAGRFKLLSKVVLFQGTDGSLAVLTLLDHQLDGDLNYYEPDILLHIENCGNGNRTFK